MSDSPEQQPPLPTQIAMELPPEVVPGVFSDFASIWHTQNTFVLDYLATIQPPTPQLDEHGQQVGQVLPMRVVARVRIPSEQIFPIMRALQTQADQWLAETGRTEPPEGFFPPANPNG